MSTSTMTVGDEEFLREFPPGTPFQVRIEGEGIESYLGQTRCGYFEWIYGERRDGVLSSFTVAYQSSEPITLVAAGKKARIAPRRVRAYLAPSVEREYGPGDESAPEVVKEYLAKGKEIAYVAEYCLEVGKTYHALVHTDAVMLPPGGPMGKPEKSRNLVLWLSDRPFADGKPTQEKTPAYRGWSY
ncbi:MAG: hypothetical protein ACOX6T_09180 [Myxococcales bacterium]|jgi:hypothetical protein